MGFKTTDYSLGERQDGLVVASEIRQRIIYMQREGWGRHWGKEREGASNGKRDAVAREQHPHRGPQKRGQRDSPLFLLNRSLSSDAEGTQKYSSRNERDGDGRAEFCVYGCGNISKSG